MSVADRLKQVLDDKRLNTKGFSELCRLPYRTAQNYLLESRSISVTALLAIRTHMSVNIDWLLTGEGEMYRSEERPLDPSVLFINARTGKPVTPADMRDMLAALKTQPPAPPPRSISFLI